MGSVPRVPNDLESRVAATARRIAELGGDEGSSVYRMSWWSERMLDWAMDHPEFKTQLFRFVDVFPALDGDDDVLRHLGEYLDGVDVPKALDLGVDVAEHVPFGKRVDGPGGPPEHHPDGRAVHRRRDRRPRPSTGLHALWRTGSATTVDLLGEKTVVAAEADRYADAGRWSSTLTDASVTDQPPWAPDDHLERDDLGPLPRVNVSVKPTALAVHYEPLTREHGLACGRASGCARSCAPARRAGRHRPRRHGARRRQGPHPRAVPRRWPTEPELADVDLGVVIQAYLRDSRDDLAEVIAVVGRPRRAADGAPGEGGVLGHRDDRAQAAGWPVPVFEHKVETDANYERCVRLLHDHHGEVRAAFASHNLRSLAYAIAYGRELGHPRRRLRDPDAARDGRAHPRGRPSARACGCGCTPRSASWCPAWPTSCAGCWRTRRNESFVRHRFAEGDDLDDAARGAAGVDALPDAGAGRAPADDRRRRPGALRPRAGARSGAAARRRDAVRRGRRAAPGPTRPSTCRPSSAAGGSAPRRTIDSVDPGRPRPGGRPGRGVRVGRGRRRRGRGRGGAAPRGAATPAVERAAVLFRAAAWMRDPPRTSSPPARSSRRASPGTRPTPTSARPSTSASTTGGRRCGSTAAAPVQSPPGEANRLPLRGQGRHRGHRPVELPPRHPVRDDGRRAGRRQPRRPQAGRADARRWPGRWSRRFEAARRCPPACSAFLPGLGEEVGARLVEHPDVAVIAFTGSRAVGLAINAAAAVAPPGPAPREAGHRRDGRQERADRRRRRRPRPGRARSSCARPSATPGRSARRCPGSSSSTGRTTRWCPGWWRRRPRLVVGHGARAGHAGRPGDRRRRPRPAAGRRGRGRRPRDGSALARTTCPTDGWYVGPTVVADVDPGVAARPRRALRPGAGRPAGRRLRPRPRAGQRHRLRPDRRGAAAGRRSTVAPVPRPSCAPATSTSTATSPAPSSAGSPSGATGCRAWARRPAVPTTSCSSSTPGPSARTPSARASRPTEARPGRAGPS